MVEGLPEGVSPMRLSDHIIDWLFPDDYTKTLTYQYAQLIKARNELCKPILDWMSKVLK